jgi:hypothetical protein
MTETHMQPRRSPAGAGTGVRRVTIQGLAHAKGHVPARRLRKLAPRTLSHESQMAQEVQATPGQPPEPPEPRQEFIGI